MKNINNYNLLHFLKSLLVIRSVENKLALKKKEKIIDSPVHLSVGQEIIPIIIHNFYRKGDIIFGNHRSHHHILSLGASIEKFFAEILCKKDGLSKGQGASMHLVDKKNGFYGSVPIVAGALSIAMGAAFALKFKKKKNIAITYFGDGATEEGLFHESMIFASKNKLPILFVVENNEYSSNLHISLRQVKNDFTRFAKANLIMNDKVNGNNTSDLFAKSKKIISSMRKKNQPFLIEVKTFRHYGHVDWKEDVDVGLKRSAKNLLKWKKKDVLFELQNEILKRKIFDKNQLNNLKKKIELEINNKWIKALNKNDLNRNDLYQNIFYEK